MLSPLLPSLARGVARGRSFTPLIMDGLMLLKLLRQSLKFHLLQDSIQSKRGNDCSEQSKGL